MENLCDPYPYPTVTYINNFIIKKKKKKNPSSLHIEIECEKYIAKQKTSSLPDEPDHEKIFIKKLKN